MDEFEEEHNGINKSSKLYLNTSHLSLCFYLHVVSLSKVSWQERAKEKILFLEVKPMVIFFFPDLKKEIFISMEWNFKAEWSLTFPGQKTNWMKSVIIYLLFLLSISLSLFRVCTLLKRHQIFSTWILQTLLGFTVMIWSYMNCLVTSFQKISESKVLKLNLDYCKHELLRNNTPFHLYVTSGTWGPLTDAFQKWEGGEEIEMQIFKWLFTNKDHFITCLH